MKNLRSGSIKSAYRIAVKPRKARITILFPSIYIEMFSQPASKNTVLKTVLGFPEKVYIFG